MVVAVGLQWPPLLRPQSRLVVVLAAVRQAPTSRLT